MKQNKVAKHKKKQQNKTSKQTNKANPELRTFVFHYVLLHK